MKKHSRMIMKHSKQLEETRLKETKGAIGECDEDNKKEHSKMMVAYSEYLYNTRSKETSRITPG